MGTHDELLAKGGLYMRLHQVQFRLQDSPPKPEPQPPSQRHPPTDSLEDIQLRLP